MSFLITGIFISLLPDTVPMHFNADWVADRYGSKYENLIMCVITLIVGVVTAAAANYRGKKGQRRCPFFAF